MDAEKNKKCLNKLNEVLSERVPKSYFSLNGYSEDAVCMEGSGNEWVVFNGERNQKFDVLTFDNVIEAGIEITSRLRTCSPDLKNLFLDSIVE